MSISLPRTTRPLSRIISSFRATIGSAFLLVSLAACEDAPLEPRGFTHDTGERVWAAVTVPDGLPDARTWLAFIGEESTTDSPAILELLADAQRGRRSGDLPGARALEDSAALRAAGMVTRALDVQTLGWALWGLDRWARRVETDVDLRSAPDIEAASVLVRAHRLAATQSLERGDTSAAVIHLTRGSIVVRGYAPEVVAHRALTHAEALLAAVAPQDGDLHDRDRERAVHLLRSSRDALGEGDAPRALRRALYALQLAAASATDPALEAVEPNR
jgi:hypothetical protein